MFIRHGQPAWIVDGTGRDDPYLTEKGQRQAAALGLRAPSLDLDEVWVSPLVRARQTAAPLGIATATLDFLEEVRTPAIAGMTPDQIATRYRGTREKDYAGWWDGIEGGESNRDFVDRISAGFDAHLSGLGFSWEDREDHRIWFDIPKEGTIAIVCHAGTTGASLAHLLAVPQVPWTWVRFGLWHTGIAALQTVPTSDGVIFAMTSFNDQEHLIKDERSR